MSKLNENYKYELHSIIELLKYRNISKKSSLIDNKIIILNYVQTIIGMKVSLCSDFRPESRFIHCDHLHNTPLCYLENLIINNIELLDMLNRIFLDTLIKM